MEKLSLASWFSSRQVELVFTRPDGQVGVISQVVHYKETGFADRIYFPVVLIIDLTLTFDIILQFFLSWCRNFWG